MAIAGGNPLFKVDVKLVEGNPAAFVGVVELPQSGEVIEQEFDADHPLYAAFARFGWETKTRNTIGAVKASERTPESAKARAEAITSAYEEGKWNVGRGEGEAEPGGGIVARAIAQVLGKDVATVVNHFKAQVAHIEDEKKRAAALRDAWDTMEADPDFAPTVKSLRDAAREARLAKKAAQAGETAKSLKSGLMGL
jgi:hypothetical protein